MKAPILYRKKIPFFHNKTNREFQEDIYERYDEMVKRQTTIHLADELWNKYPPLYPILEFAKDNYPNTNPANILEIGSGVGKWIGTIAQLYPESNCWGIDYSYQMLKRSHEFWIEGREVIIDQSARGFRSNLKIKGYELKNLQFGLAKAEHLPFLNNSQDLIVSSFLLDRLENPYDGLLEMYRILNSRGRIILITPFNFRKAKHWEIYYPPERLYGLIAEIGLNILRIQENILIEEPLDFHGNMINWRCTGIIMSKSE